MFQGMQAIIGSVPRLRRSLLAEGGMAMDAPATLAGDDKDKKKKKAPAAAIAVAPAPNPTPRPDDEALRRFGDFAGTNDTKEIAKHLMKKGLAGADQLYTDQPDINSEQGITNAQSDWKPSAISKMLIRARSLNIKTPTQVRENQAAILGGMDERYQAAIKHPAFNQNHSNFWSVFSDILQDQYKNEKQSSGNPIATR